MNYMSNYNHRCLVRVCCKSNREWRNLTESKRSEFDKLVNAFLFSINDCK